MPTASPISVLLAADEQIRRVLVTLLAMEEGIDVVAEAGHGDEIAEAVGRHRPDVAVLDAELTGVDGLTAAPRIGAHCAVVVLTSIGRPDYLRRAMAVGVRGFLGKEAPAEELASAIRKVAAGGRYLDTELSVASMATGDDPLSRLPAASRDSGSGGERGLPRPPGGAGPVRTAEFRALRATALAWFTAYGTGGAAPAG
ncbi:response regulator transcription factor [Nonomuraea sp. PA05]|uniref:response regulator n=1 Tax=Nonomuraea sp. PA05 TaxID=2604466 RepID=UPI0011D62A5A|nr:response regulator [Nonomuraea sp. PA05]TYB57210.1 response regulator transcription factor [Nonomuraea sp. PA05]